MSSNPHRANLCVLFTFVGSNTANGLKSMADHLWTGIMEVLGCWVFGLKLEMNSFLIFTVFLYCSYWEMNRSFHFPHCNLVLSSVENSLHSMENTRFPHYSGRFPQCSVKNGKNLKKHSVCLFPRHIMENSWLKIIRLYFPIFMLEKWESQAGFTPLDPFGVSKSKITCLRFSFSN